eukprot:Rmarinus@m.17320
MANDVQKSFKIKFIIRTNERRTTSDLRIVGSAPSLGSWDVNAAPELNAVQRGPGTVAMWESKPIVLTASDFPVSYKYLANTHTGLDVKPMIWEVYSRVLQIPKEVEDVHLQDDIVFCQTPAGRDSGWVTGDSIQLRIHVSSVTLHGQSVPLHHLQQARRQIKQLSMLDDDIDSCSSFTSEAYEVVPRALQNGKAFLKRGTMFFMNDDGKDGPSFRVEIWGQNHEKLRRKGTVDPLSKGFWSPWLSFSPEKKIPMVNVATAIVPSSMLRDSESVIRVPLCDSENRLIGEVKIEYLLIRPFSHPNCNLEQVFRSRWKQRPTLDIGHRGDGVNKSAKRSHVQENTLLTFQKCANAGADFVEFDVQLTKDEKLLVYHDYVMHVNVGKGSDEETIAAAVKDMTLEKCRSLNLRTRPHGERLLRERLERVQFKRENTMKRFCSHSDIEDKRELGDITQALSGAENGLPVESPVLPENSNQQHHPRWTLADELPTLDDVLDSLPMWLGFNIELKYPMSDERDQLGFESYFSRELVVTKLLETVFARAKSRRIIFSTFDPTCAELLCIKQPRYPVMFLTEAGKGHYRDDRCNSLEAAVAFAKEASLTGIVAESTPIINNPALVERIKDEGLVLFTYGEHNSQFEYVRLQRDIGVDAIISDGVSRITKQSGKSKSQFRKSKSSGLDLLASVSELRPSEESISSSTENSPALFDACAVQGGAIAASVSGSSEASLPSSYYPSEGTDKVGGETKLSPTTAGLAGGFGVFSVDNALTATFSTTQCPQ